MKLEQSFEVAAPLEQVWKALVDVERVAPCLPGAAVTGRNDDGTYGGSFTVKIGPTTASYTGKLEMTSIDEGSHVATMYAQGSDTRGQGGAKATIESRLMPVDGTGTRVEVVTDYHITGRLARFGRGGMIEDISERLLKEFAERLQASLGGGASGRSSAGAAAGPPAPEEAGEAERSPWLPPVAPGGGSPEAPGAGPTPGTTPGATGAGSTPGTTAGATGAGPTPGSTPGAGSTPETVEPLDAGALVGGVLVDRVKRNPAPYVVAALVLLLLLRRRRKS